MEAKLYLVKTKLYFIQAFLCNTSMFLYLVQAKLYFAFMLLDVMNSKHFDSAYFLKNMSKINKNKYICFVKQKNEDSKICETVLYYIPNRGNMRDLGKGDWELCDMLAKSKTIIQL